MAQHAGARAGDVICFGHTHIPWRREADGIHFVNTGSVGRPKDANPHAGYVVLDAGQTTHVDLVRVGYDVGEATRGILGSELPAEFGDYLGTGGKRLPAGSG